MKNQSIIIIFIFFFVIEVVRIQNEGDKENIHINKKTINKIYVIFFS
jgi:hypothetical protein